MSTEYRRGIPCTAHVEAATRLGIEWEEVRPHCSTRRWRFQIRGSELWCDFWSDVSGWDRDLWPLSSGRIADRTDVEHYTFRPIRPDGTPVDWEVLDQETPDHIAARWTVYQELKPLYDIVDGAVGEVAMPRDVLNQWWLSAQRSDRARQPIEHCTLIRCNASPRYPQGRGPMCSWYADGTDALDIALRNFAAVLDAVAERRVAERMRGQTQAPTVTSAQPPAPIGTVMVQDADGTVRPARMNDTARVIGLAGIDMPAAVRPAAQPEPRRFADVRPDRHGWRWWRQTGRDSTDLGQRFETLDGRCRWRSAHADAWFVPDTANPQMLRYTVIPTDEQGNPVSWESIGPTDPTEIRLTSASNAPDRHGTRWAASVSAMQNYAVPDIYITVGTDAKPTQTEAVTTLPPPLPRFTTDELDDVDHSKTTKLDEVTLRRGKLPTVEQIAKYREVRARRAGGTVADALKESRIDCEVAQYVLERWAGGLGDADTVLLLRAAGCIAPLKDAPRYSIRAFDPKQGEVDRRSRDFLRTHNAALDTSEKPSPTVQRERQEAEERRQRLAELRQRLAAERAAQPQEMAKESDTMSRFDLIEPDPKADPAASIRAWEARQAAVKVRPTAAPPRIAKPAAVPRRPAIEVVDAEAEGLSRSEAFTALFGRALNGGC